MTITQSRPRALTHDFTYKAALRAAQRQNWKIEDLIGPGNTLDFSRRFLPEGLARVEGLTFLSADERRLLNQIRANGYLATFALVEEFILPFVLDHARPTLAADDWRTRALLQFAGEEAKHIQLFKAFLREFEAGFGTPCATIGPAEAIASVVLAKPRLAVALVILQVEWMTQKHYLESIVEDSTLDTRFKGLLRHHWQEEAQHAQIDTLLVEELIAAASEEERAAGLEGFLEIGMFLDEGLGQQAELDLASFERASGRTLDARERGEFLACQRQAMRWTYLGSGMNHPRFLAALELLGAGAREKIEAIAPSFS